MKVMFISICYVSYCICVEVMRETVKHTVNGFVYNGL